MTWNEGFYSCIVSPQMRGARALAEKIKEGKVGSKGQFSAREVYRMHWSGLDTPEDVRRAADILEDAGWIRPVMEPNLGKGRPASMYLVNPKLWRQQ